MMLNDGKILWNKYQVLLVEYMVYISTNFMNLWKKQQSLTTFKNPQALWYRNYTLGQYHK